MAKFGKITGSATVSSERADELTPPGVQAFLDGLPPFDVDARLAGVSQLLDQMLANPLTVDQQHALLRLIDPQVYELLSGYQEKIHHYALPLPPQRQKLYNGLQALLNRGARAYKRLIHDSLSDRHGDMQQTALRDAIMRCIDYLTQQVLQAYAVYRDSPPHVWKELHLLYAYAENKQLATDVVEHLSELSISGAYARALLLAISDPAHLLQGEVYTAYEKLRKWGLAVRLQRLEELPVGAPEDPLRGHYFCDLDGQSPPAFGDDDLTTVPGNVRLLDLAEVLRIIDSRLKGLALESRRSLKVRAEWDLLLRLKRAWQTRAHREQLRKPEHGTTVKAIINLSSCHYFFSGYQQFEPEKSEIRMHGDDFQQTQTLSLVDMDASPWLDSDTESKLEAGVIKPRAYCFDVENKENDVWKKSHVRSKQDTTLEKNLDERRLATVFEFKLINSSDGGLGLETVTASRAQIRVGELIALFYDDSGDDDPVLNVVRWIRCVADDKLQLGVGRIEGEPTPLAVRALDDAAVYKEYTRAFAVNDGKTATLIAPAGQIDCGATLLANDEETISFIKLDSLVDNSRAFSRFQFQTLDPGTLAAGQVVESLRALLRRDSR